jgi:hypothetical protein
MLALALLAFVNHGREAVKIYISFLLEYTLNSINLVISA